MTKYRVTRSINCVVEADADGDIYLQDVLGLSGSWAEPSEFRDAGFAVDLVEDPSEDPAGTVRKFRISGDLIVKGSDGKWRYVTTSHSFHEVGEILPHFPEGFINTEVVLS